jgi:hypothetical protein
MFIFGRMSRTGNPFLPSYFFLFPTGAVGCTLRRGIQPSLACASYGAISAAAPSHEALADEAVYFKERVLPGFELTI